MAEPGVTDQYQKSSPWPMFVALGLVLSEFGVFMGGPFVPVAIGGILLLEGCIIGILRESGYTDVLWKPALGLGSLFTFAGAALLTLTTYETRGTAVTLSGALAVLAAIGLWLYETRRL